jgi:hypothetical protein
VVPNYLVFAVLVTLCCCVPLGIPALVYSAQVSSRLAGGDVGGAMRCSRLARLWCWAALASGVFLAGLYFLLMVAGAALDSRG